MNERFDPDNPLHVELTHKDGKFAGYYDCGRDMLLLFSRGQVMRYPQFLRMVEKTKQRAALLVPAASE